MRFRKLALAVSLAGALGCEMASALGLGEIKLNSTLNQPLDAEIKLLRLRELGEGEILVNVASREDFQRAGVDRVFFLNDLKFEIIPENPSGPIIKVTSRKVVREPFLNFLLETQWPNGRILREYTLLMDLPVFGDESARAVTPAAISRPEPVVSQPAVVASVRESASVAEPAASAPEREAEQPAVESQPQRAAAPAKRVEGGVYGPVSSSDTLWEIALKARPDRSYSVQQTMLAIQRLNPEAFINGNINLLRKGQVLRLPKASQISELNSRQAVNEVAFQNDQWSGDANGNVSGAQLDGSGRTQAAPTAVSDKKGRLKLASSADVENVDAGRGAGEVGGDTDALQNELAITLDELDKTRRDNGELKSRIDELEMQIQTMERLVDVSSQELRALQLAGQQAVDSDPNPIDAADDGDLTPAVDVAAVAQAPVAKVVDASKVVISAPKPEPSFFDSVFDNIALVAGGLIALLAALVLILRRRKDDDNPDDDFSVSMDDEPLFVSDELTAEEELSADELDTELAGQEPEVDAEMEEFELGELEIDGVESESDEATAVSTESQTGDAVGEADIYIAYGKYDQAEEMLLKALDTDADALNVRMKLLEVYAETNETVKFDDQYSYVLAADDVAAHERAASLRQQLSDAGEYNPDAVNVAVESEALEGDELTLDDGLDFDFDLDVSADDALATDEALEFESGLDLDLADVAETTGTDDDLSFDLDFELDEDISVDSGLALEGAENDALLGSNASDDDAFSLELELGDEHLQDALSLDGDSEAVDDFDLPALDDVVSLDSELELDTGDFEGGSLDELSILSDELTNDLDADEVSELSVQETNAEPDFDLEFDLGADESSLGVLGDDDSLAVDLDLALELDDAVDLGASLEVVSPSDDVADDDHFDMDLGDVDLASLDLEVDALSADLDLGDDDFAALVLEESVEGDELAEAADLMSADLELGEDVSSGLEMADSAALELDATGEDLGEFDSFELDASELEVLEQVQSEEITTLDIGLDEIVETELDLPEPLLELSVNEVDDMPVEFAAFDSAEATGTEDVALELGDFGALDAGEEVSADTAELEPEFDLAADLGLDTADELPSTEEGMFDAALADLPEPEEALEGLSELPDEEDAELDFLADTDEAATKLDLARAYIDMGDQEGAKDILDEVIQEGSEEQRSEADELLARMS